MVHNLLLTLGHNSSAILVEQLPNAPEHRIVCGYEEERLTLKKSDSSFPINAILRCMQVAQIDEVQCVYVSHWAPDGRLDSMSKKHWQPENLPKHVQINSLDGQFTHHDAHAFAAEWYAFSKPGLKREGSMIFVIDGFGNFGEHISIYSLTSTFGIKLVRRFFGYEGSLGLMYQYMTAFMGMKMHEDEYKILGYEVLIHTVDVDLNLLHKRINQEVTKYLDGYFNPKKLVGQFDPMLRLDALPALQHSLIQKWSNLCRELGIDDPKSHEGRVILGYYVQAILEGVVLTLVNIYKPTNLIASGGVFYNVKLNRRLMDAIPGKLCVYPLAGDQGNALGVFCRHQKLKWPGHLYWGKRPKPNITHTPAEGLIVAFSEEDAASLLVAYIDHAGMANLVRGAMEFGPRALCNTSTLAVPSAPVVSRINRMNGRNTVMPMAPVMNRSEFHARMQMTGRVHLSEEHMIVAMPYKNGAERDVLGAAHPYPTEYTGRPQVIDGDSIMDYLFTYRPVLINTSFNVHGRPIAYSFDDVVANHMHERKTELITTVYLGEGEKDETSSGGSD